MAGRLNIRLMMLARPSARKPAGSKRTEKPLSLSQRTTCWAAAFIAGALQAQLEAEQQLITVTRDKDIAAVQSQQATQEADIDAGRQIIVAEQNKELAQKEREKQIETAERAKQTAIEKREAERATAEAERLRMETEKEKAAQDVLTVKMTEQA